MKKLLQLLRWDTIFLIRYQLFTVSILVTGLYWLVFQGMKEIGGDALLMMVIYNDPILLGLIFGGLLLIMDRNQFTIAALAATPLPMHLYILSKLIVLSILGVLLAFVLWWSIVGMPGNPFIFMVNILLITAFCTLIGFIIGLRETMFLRYMIQCVGALLVFAIPFLGYFEVVPNVFLIWMPLGMSLALHQPDLSLLAILSCILGLLIWNGIAVYALYRKVKRYGWT